MLSLPSWILSALVEQWGRLQAAELRNAATVAALPYMKSTDRGRVLRQWDRATRATTNKAAEVVEVNPEKARAYFAALGVKVAEDG